MKPIALLALSLLSASPSIIFAQSYPEPPEVAVAPEPPTPPAAKAPRAAVAVRPAIAAPPAQAPQAPQPPQTVQPPKSAPAVPAAPAMMAVQATPPVPPAPPRKRGQMINVRIEVTLTDSKGQPKVLTMTVADQESGMNRTTAVVVPGAMSVDYSFNADASPEVVGERIRLRLTADAVVPVEAERPTAIVPKLGLRQSQTVILNDGESVEIARAADPSSARTFILSVKATIQR